MRHLRDVIQNSEKPILPSLGRPCPLVRQIVVLTLVLGEKNYSAVPYCNICTLYALNLLLCLGELYGNLL